MSSILNTLYRLEIWAYERPYEFLCELRQSLPHCGVSPSLPMTASLTPYRRVYLRNIDFLSFRHVGKFLNHSKLRNVLTFKTSNGQILCTATQSSFYYRHEPHSTTATSQWIATAEHSRCLRVQAQCAYLPEAASMDPDFAI